MDFYGQLISRGWIRFPDEPIKDNHPFMVEFYANALETDFGGVVVTTV